jgi:hypothetical protein
MLRSRVHERQAHMSGQLLSKTPCGFCEQPRKLTKEHVFGQWLSAVFGADKKTNTVRHTLMLDGKQRGVWQSDKVDHKVRMACGQCNQGWMNGLETTVQPLITPMIRGTPAALNLKNQKAIATWAVKTAMVAEYLKPEAQRFFTHEDRRSLMETLEPAGTRTDVWLTRYAGRNDGVLSDTVALTLQNRVIGCHVSAFALGQFAVQVCVHRLNPGEVVATRPGPWDRLLVAIWPLQARPVTWPPTLAVANPQGFDTLFNRFFSPLP